MSSVERRYTPLPVEARGDSKTMKIGGYAAVFNRESQNLGGFVERVLPGFFNDSKSRGWPDVMARYNHDDNMLLGTTGAGTLSLSVDETGLSYDVVPPQSRADVYELVARGDVRKSSFAFRTFEDSWSSNEQGYPLRSLVSGQLVDVAPVNVPAYTDTTAGKRAAFVVAEAADALRSLAAAMHADEAEVRALAEADDLRKFFVRTDNRGPAKPAVMTRGAAASLLARRLAEQKAF
jgi:HK97 family phage prohead protease